MEESCTKENLRVEKADAGFEFVSKRVTVSNSSARRILELKEEMLCESKAQYESQICVKLACTVLCTRLLLLLGKIKMKTSDMEHMEDYTRCDNRTKVVGTK